MKLFISIFIENICKCKLRLILFIFIFSNQIQAQGSIILNRFDIMDFRSDPQRDSTLSAFTSSIQYQKGNDNYTKLLPVYSHTSFNSSFAYGFNDGPQWQGRGLNQSFSFGFQGKAGILEYTIAPIISYSQNLDYDYLSGRDAYPSYQGRPEFQNVYTAGADYVMRYGDNAYRTIHPGQSEISLRFDHMKIGFGTANQWWGPGLFQSGLMSNHAPGFPHLRFGNHRPYEWKLGSFSMQWIFGILRESNYFNDNPTDDLRIFNGSVINFAPSFFPGLNFSLQRSIQLIQADSDSYLDYGMIFTDFLRFSQRNSDGTITERKDQMFSLGLDWRSKSDDFRIYFEWVRGDFFSDIVDLLEQPEHNVGWIWGFVKDFPLKKSEQYLRLVFEQANLAAWETARVRSSGSLYTHSSVGQGYTNNGQMLAASIGPGSSFHGFNLSWVRPKSQLTLEYLRTRSNDDVFFLFIGPSYDNRMDIHHFIGLNNAFRFSSFEIQGNIAVSIREHTNLVPYNMKINLRPELFFRYYW